MNVWMFALPAPLALSLVALIGYWIGCRRSLRYRPPNPSPRELVRAKRVIQALEQISRQVRDSLESHDLSMVQFKDRLDSLSRARTRGGTHDISDEAERMLEPTLRLSGEIARAYEQIRQQTALLMAFTDIRTDALTGLQNRRALDEALTTWFAMKARHRREFSLAIFDIDYFKSMNDQHGHLYGDRVLQTVAQTIAASTRDSDFVARFGGEEFVVLMPETDLSGAFEVAERIRDRIESELPVTISGGVAVARANDTPQTLLGRADAALYEAKVAGRNTVRANTPDGNVALSPVACQV